MDEPTYYASADAMLRNYWKTIGEALARGIKVYYDGDEYPSIRGELRGMGDLNSDIWQHDHPGKRMYSGDPIITVNYFRK